MQNIEIGFKLRYNYTMSFWFRWRLGKIRFFAWPNRFASIFACRKCILGEAPIQHFVLGHHLKSSCWETSNPSLFNRAENVRRFFFVRAMALYFGQRCKKFDKKKSSPYDGTSIIEVQFIVQPNISPNLLNGRYLLSEMVHEINIENFPAAAAAAAAAVCFLFFF